MNEIYAPVCIIAYNRADKIKKVIESLAKNHLANKTRVYVFSDAARDSKAAKGVAEVREYLRSLKVADSKKLQNLDSKNLENIESNLDSKTNEKEMSSDSLTLKKSREAQTAFPPASQCEKAEEISQQCEIPLFHKEAEERGTPPFRKKSGCFFSQRGSGAGDMRFFAQSANENQENDTPNHTTNENTDSIESKNVNSTQNNIDVSLNAQHDKTIESNNKPPTILPFKSIEIIEAEHNLGIKDSIVKYANFIFKNKGYDRFIGLEDDIETHENFLQFMNDALQFYKDNPRIMAITAFSHQSANLKSRTIKNYKQDVLFTYAFHSWGWGTWRERWENIDWSHAEGYAWFMLNPYHLVRGNILSWFHLFALPRSQKRGRVSNLWDIYLSYIAYKQDKLVVWPARRSYTRNFGFDGSGVHTFNFDANIVNFSFDNPPAHLHFTNKMNLGLWFNFKLSMLYGVDVWVFGFFKMFVKKIYGLFGRKDSKKL